MLNTAPRLEEPIVADDVLAERASSGSARAFEELVARYGDVVYTIASNLCGTPDAAEAALQETFLAAWRDLPSFPAGARFSTWLYRIATRTAFARPEKARPRASRGVRADIGALLQDALDRLDDKARAAFVLCDVVALRAEEAAVILDLPPKDVRRRVHRTRLFLHGLIDSRPTMIAPLRRSPA